MKLLYAEDEMAMSEAVCDVLTFHNYIVDVVHDGEAALEYAQLDSYDGIILDVMMPKKSGLEVLKLLRKNGCKTPIMLLTAKAQIEDQVEGLNMGADDYLPKPFPMSLLIARLQAMLRRKEEYIGTVLQFGNVTLNQSNSQLSTADEAFTLPKLEYQLMELLMINTGLYLSTEDIFCKVWGYDTDAEIGTVWVYISYLRKRLVALNANIAIVAKRNIGYRLEELHD